MKLLELLGRKPKDADSDDELTHVCCCRDEDVSLCGVDLTDSNWDHDKQNLQCVVCDDLERSDWCPKGGRCVCTWAQAWMRHG